MLDDAAIDACLAAACDTHERLDPETWRATCRQGQQTFRLFVRRAGPWVRLELSPFVPVPESPERAGYLYRELLARNRTLIEARFALADDGDVILESVLDAAAERAALEAALDAVLAAAELHYAALRNYAKS